MARQPRVMGSLQLRPSLRVNHHSPSSPIIVLRSSSEFASEPDRSHFFDLDGTLTDPKVGITRCIQHALGALGVTPPDADDLTWCIGPPLLESFRSMLGDDALAAVALKHYRARFSEVGLYENRLYDGVPEALQRLSGRAISLYVADKHLTVAGSGRCSLSKATESARS